MTRGTRVGVLLGVTAVAAAAACVVPPIPQDAAYHRFADTRPLGGAANGCTVLSILPFVFVGLWGLQQVLRPPPARPLRSSSPGSAGHTRCFSRASRSPAWARRTAAGDLRPYVLVQFAPAALIPLTLWLFPARYTHGGYLVGIIAIYGAAKLFEALNGPIFSMGHLLSGHMLKHLTAALAAWWPLRGLDARRPAAAEERT